MAERRRNKAMRDADAGSGHVGVYIIGPREPVPLRIGANTGSWPIRIGITTNPRNIKKAAQQWNWHEVEVRALLWTNDQEDAYRLKSLVDEAIARLSEHIRGSWRDLDPALAQMTLEIVARETGIEVFDEAERWQRLRSAVNSAVMNLR